MKIKVLDEKTINGIAAGEVVERPAAVVRELVDNSRDAGATSISVDLESGGSRLIKVSDNGSGMGRDDAILAFERHATSKISSLKDINSVQTMGFRGEALASIAAVSKVVLETRRAETEIGTRIEIRAGSMKGVDSVARSAGTEIRVSNLFFNTPARKKFLAKPDTEIQRIKRWIKHYSLGAADVAFDLHSSGKPLLKLPRADDLFNRAERVFGAGLSKLTYEEGQYQIEGMVGAPSNVRSAAYDFAILVNGRLVSDRMLLRAVRDGYQSMLKPKEYPVGFLSIVIPAELIDVNVHPQKSEVRFSRSRTLYQLVKTAVFSAVSEFRGPVSTTYFSTPQTDQRAESNYYSASSLFESPVPAPAYASSISHPESASTKSRLQVPNGNVENAIDAESAADLKPFPYSSLKYVGMVLGCYLLCELDQNLYAIDMHAAHERCNFNLIREGFRKKSLDSQVLLVPITVEVGEEGVARCKEESQMLAGFGFEIESFGASSIVVRSAPSIIPTRKLNDLFREIAASDFSEQSGNVVESELDHVVARLACHASIRSGETVSPEEVYALFEQLEQTELAGACPHGRPVVARFSRADVERWFGRDR